ncbi:hypothetical protein E2C01_098682 [Portunus trituberculatus]|uniref:Uncharacterized protein n=1 Tax=Portunus trituberculatus TaxID=210409 RepID=A0A5B7K8V7_PORTR|nr:hypothetical protein [Portunus trituberculatus]
MRVFHDVDAVPVLTMRFHDTILKSTGLHRYWSESFHPVRVHPRPLGASRVTLLPSCAAIELRLPTPVLRRTLSPRKDSTQTLECDESDFATSLRPTRVAMINDSPHTTPQTLSVSPFHPVKDHWYCQCLVHGAQHPLVHCELFSTVPL